MKLSLILPIYNVERFLGDCLDSLYAQDVLPEEYEIICVCDGSSDNSQIVVEQYMQTHSNIQLIVQDNKGVSAARNEGFRRAKGKYVWFIDPDDVIVANCFAQIIYSLEKANADIFEMQYRTCEEDFEWFPQPVSFQIDGTNKPGSSGSGCLYVCRKQYLEEQEITWEEGLAYGEDYLWAFQIKYRKHKSIYTDTPLYFYRQRCNSAMKTFDITKKRKRINDMVTLHSLYQKEYDRCLRENMDAKILVNILERQQLCIESALMCLMTSVESVAEIKRRLTTWEEAGLYPYRIKFWKLFENNSLKLRVVTFFFPIKGCYLLMCRLYRKLKR